jgi:hypothetical protein
VLLLHRRVAAAWVWEGLRCALRVESVDPALVAMEARRYADGHGDDEPRLRGLAKVIALPSALPADDRGLPTLFDYDQLLARQDAS